MGKEYTNTIQEKYIKVNIKEDAKKGMGYLIILMVHDMWASGKRT